MKRKLLCALALVVSVVSVATGMAATAQLGGKAFVEQVLAPKVPESASEMWTFDEIQEILRLAEGCGITLSDDNMALLQNPDGYYKEETMRIFAKEELGFYPGAWSIEDQYWYDQLLIKSGVPGSTEPSRFLPEGDELTEAQARQIALERIFEHDADADIDNEAIYTRITVYSGGVDDDGKFVKWWDIEYFTYDMNYTSYVFIITSEGAVTHTYIFPGNDIENGIIITPDEFVDNTK